MKYKEIRAQRFNRNPLNYHGEGPPPKDRFKEEEIEELRGYISDFIGPEGEK